MKIRIYVDFNTMSADQERRVLINTNVQQELRGQLYEGLPVVVFDEEMEVNATIENSEYSSDYYGGTAWLARPDWATRRIL